MMMMMTMTIMITDGWLFIHKFLLHISPIHLYGILLHYEIGCKASSSSVMEVNPTCRSVSVSRDNK